MVVKNETPVGRRVCNVFRHFHRMCIGDAIGEAAQKRHEKYRHCSGCHECRRGILLHGARFYSDARHSNDDRQRCCAVEGNGDAMVRAHRIGFAVQRHCDEHRHSADEQKQHDECHEQPRLCRHSTNVDASAADDKENRNEKTVANALELELQCFHPFRDHVA